MVIDGRFAHRRKLTVLILNDSPDVLTTLRQWFSDHGHKPVTAQMAVMRELAHDVKEIIEQHRPDVIIYDIGIPYRAHVDNLEMLQVTGTFDGVPVVVTTPNKAALGGISTKITALELVGLKPDMDAILSAVENAPRRKRTG